MVVVAKFVIITGNELDKQVIQSNATVLKWGEWVSLFKSQKMIWFLLKLELSVEVSLIFSLPPC